MSNSKAVRTCCPRSAAFHDRTHKDRGPLRGEVYDTRFFRLVFSRRKVYITLS